MSDDQLLADYENLKVQFLYQKATIEELEQDISRFKEEVLLVRARDAETLSKMRRERDKYKNEVEKWQEIERLSGSEYSAIYADVYKLKPGKRAAKPRKIEQCDPNDPENRLIHDEICDVLSENGMNEADVCTASVGIWMAIHSCREAWK